MSETSERGSPRVQYERSYVLLPPNVDATWAVAVAEGSWDAHRYTVGGSADDAGIGDLDVRRVIAVNPDWWEGDLAGFFAKHYSGAEIIAVYAETPVDLVQALQDLDHNGNGGNGGNGDEFPLRGVHDRAGADWLLQEGLQGWATLPVYVNLSPAKLNLAQYAAAGIRVLVNLRYSYAVDDGGQGTMPGPDKLAAFEAACIETMRQNSEAWAFVYCNEMNNPREWPEGYGMLPGYYTDSYDRMWAAKPASARLMPGAIDPYNPGWGDWRKLWGNALSRITDCDGLAWHAYTHGPDPALIWGERRFGDAPLVGVYYDMRVLEDQQEIVPERFAGLPQVVTETNHLTRRNGSIGWEPDAGEWVREAYRYLASRGVLGACLFRFGFEDWRFGDLPEVLTALRQV